MVCKPSREPGLFFPSSSLPASACCSSVGWETGRGKSRSRPGFLMSPLKGLEGFSGDLDFSFLCFLYLLLSAALVLVGKQEKESPGPGQVS